MIVAASLHIACKYEEIYPPCGREILKRLAPTYQHCDLCSTEKEILFSLDFSISETTVLRFLERAFQISQAPVPVRHMAKYLIELALLDSKMCQYPPSVQASAALYVALRVVTLAESRQNSTVSDQSCWSSDLQKHTSYSTN
jgi:G2/mitotic-specific cyclin-B, other